ncbi:MAG TPA: carbohydrate-binding family 9-like protein [Pyrinomonadaceae bacterium]|nr:carbohydrate-binding family 9-like protein [Pyrinomonadaceae bacterium]
MSFTWTSCRKLEISLFAVLIANFCCQALGQKQDRMIDRLKIAHISEDFSVTELDSKNWNRAQRVNISSYWSGQAAPRGRGFSAKLLWSDGALYVRFEGPQTEPLVVSDKPDLTKKTLGLWDRDVCEIFIAPDHTKPNKYFEFEVAPTGEWVDLGIEVLPNKRATDWDYVSGMLSVALITKDHIVLALRVPWTAFGRMPKPGEKWRGNLFRCVGKDPNRGYLAWQPTMTKEPAFHVPEKFGTFIFVG